MNRPSILKPAKRDAATRGNLYRIRLKTLSIRPLKVILSEKKSSRASNIIGHEAKEEETDERDRRNHHVRVLRQKTSEHPRLQRRGPLEHMRREKIKLPTTCTHICQATTWIEAEPIITCHRLPDSFNQDLTTDQHDRTPNQYSINKMD